MTTQPIRPERTERHNPSVDEEWASAGRCAQIHLPTGRICVREHPHRGSCEFVTPDHAYDLVSSGRLPAGPCPAGAAAER